MENIFNADYAKYISVLSEVFVHIFGEKYRDLIKNRLNTSFFVTNISCGCFEHSKDFDNYVFSLKKFYMDKYNRKFIDYVNDCCFFSKKIDYDDFSSLFDFFPFDSFFNEFDRDYSISALRSFFVNIDEYSENNINTIINYQISLINFILDSDNITGDNYEEFKKTDKYNELLVILRKLYDYYLNLYSDYEKDLSPYQNYFDYIEIEKNKRKKIVAKYYDEIKKYAFFEFLNVKCDVDVDKLLKHIRVTDESWWEPRDLTVIFHDYYSYSFYNIANYLKCFDIDIYDEYSVKCSNILDIETDKETISNILCKYSDYFFDYDKLKEFINNKYKNLKLELFFSNDRLDKFLINDFCGSEPIVVGNNMPNIEYLFNEINDIESGNFITHGNYVVHNELQYLIIFLTPVFGNFMDCFVHECCHRLFCINNKCGFDLVDENKKCFSDKRKYEVFNECLNDIFTNEAMDYLIENDIYFFEDKEFVNLNYKNDMNMPAFIREFVRKFLDKFFDFVVECKFDANIFLLKERFGEDLFEEFIDIINHLFYLSQNKLDINDSSSNGYNDYLEDVNRADLILSKMEKAYNSYKVNSYE